MCVAIPVLFCWLMLYFFLLFPREGSGSVSLRRHRGTPFVITKTINTTAQASLLTHHFPATFNVSLMRNPTWKK